MAFGSLHDETGWRAWRVTGRTVPRLNLKIIQVEAVLLAVVESLNDPNGCQLAWIALYIIRVFEQRLEVIERATQSQDEGIRLRAACWFLEHTQPSHFARNRIELTGADGQQLAAGVTLYLPQKETAPVERSVVTVHALTEGGESEHA